MTTKEPKNTDKDWGAPEKLPLKRRMRRWLGVVAFIVAVHLVLAYLFSIPLVRHYAFIGRIIYDSTIGQVWRETREARQEKNRDLTLPNGNYKTVAAGVSYTGYSNAFQRETLVWIDDETVLFTGRKDKPPETTIDQPDIYRWTIAGETTLYREKAYTECYADGKLLFWKLNSNAPSEKQMVYYYGAIGQELQVNDLARVDKVGCSPLTKEDLKSPGWRYGGKLPLRKGDGILIYNHFNNNHEVLDGDLMLEKIDGVRISYPIKNSEYENSIYIKYYPYKNAYLLSPIANKKQMPQRVWWIFTDGRAESIPAPRKLAYGNMHSTRVGLIYSGFANENSDKRSLFLAKPNGDIEQLMKDDVRIEDIAVSPSGCKIAFFAFNMLRQRQNFGPWVFSIDFCHPANMEK